MGTSSEYKYRPEMVLQVQYIHRNKSVDTTSMIREIISDAYFEEPWKLDGEHEPLSVYFSDFHNGVVYGGFTVHASFVNQVLLKVSQQAAYERMCRRIAEALANSARTWCVGCNVLLNVSYKSIDGELFLSR